VAKPPDDLVGTIWVEQPNKWGADYGQVFVVLYRHKRDAEWVNGMTGETWLRCPLYELVTLYTPHPYPLALSRRAFLSGSSMYLPITGSYPKLDRLF
jgi:hypothetical protein